MTVYIIFQPPSRPDLPHSPTVHKRTLKGVPPAVAEEMVEDLSTYDGNSATSNQWKVYRYQKLEEENLEEDSLGAVTVPLDYREVIDIEIAENPVTEAG